MPAAAVGRGGEAMDAAVFIYALYFSGVILWQYGLLTALRGAVRNRLLIRRSLKQLTDSEDLKVRTPLGRQIQLLIEGAEAGRFFTSPEQLQAGSLVCGLGTAFVVAFLEEPAMALLCGAFAGAMPCCILLARLHARRVSRSREGDILVQEILNNYKIYDYNMKEAIEVTAATMEDAPEARRLVLQLAKGLQRAVTRREVEQVLSVFRYSLDTAWGNALAANILFACVYGIRVDAAMEDLLGGIVKSRQVVEHGKRENNEARMMLKYLAPVSFALSVAAACRYFDFTLGKFLRYQLGTALGLKWFLIMVMLYAAGVLINMFFSREKMDI